MRCVNCEQTARFDVEELLDEFLKERFKQKLIYNFYRENFDQFGSESHSKKVLEGHIKRLCEKCSVFTPPDIVGI